MVLLGFGSRNYYCCKLSFKHRFPKPLSSCFFKRKDVIVLAEQAWTLFYGSPLSPL